MSAPNRPRQLLFPSLLVMLLAGCAGLLPGTGTQVADPLAPHRQAMLPAFQDMLESLDPLPEYRIDVLIQPEDLSVRGRMTLTIPPGPGGELPLEYYFRLYPNLAHYAANMTIDLVTINGKGAPFSYAASNTAVHVPVPPDAALPEQPVTVGLQWDIEARSWPSTRYSLFGEAEGVFSLPLFYPILAAQDEETPSGWHLDVGLIQGDAAFSDVALYQVTATVPSGIAIAATGSVLSVSETQTLPVEEGDGDQLWVDWVLASGPVREFALFLSDRFGLAQTTAGDVTINSWYVAGDEITGRAAAEYTAAALRIYDELFGPYPYVELDVVAGPLTYRGMEYPGLFELGVELYRDKADELEFRIAHEVAHQWWYGLVGNDPVNVPWLDEGLAEYTTYFYRQKTKGQETAQLLVDGRWLAAYEYARNNGLDAVVDQPVEAFLGNYEIIVYGKGALFFDALNRALGEEQFLELLRRYLETYRFQTATPEDFLALAQEAAGPVAADLYQQWILSAEEPPGEQPE